jgi:putative nucleotidyltransferase with HDIG domain
MVFFKKDYVRALNIVLAFLISIIYNFNPIILFSFAISGGFSLFLYEKDEKELNYVFPFIIGSFLLVLIVSVFDFFFNIPLYFDLISISWSLIALPILYITIQLLKVYSPFFKKYDILNYLDLEHPLLKMIRDKAPGTWQHSLAMANMAETVANEIGANGMLCRAGAYFHDIGKIKHPEYFIENQDGENPHNALSPTESARMIKLHVTDGIKMAEEYMLPEYIAQFIDKHHGTTILEYFYEKAASVEGDTIDVEDFRYPGRKPDSKETAILMIVDAVEAASRTLTEPTQQDIETLITRIVFSKLLFNQLNQSGITLADLRKIIVTLINSLKSNSHTRVKYPWQTKNVKKEK